MVLHSPSATFEVQAHILSETDCSAYVQPEGIVAATEEIVKRRPNLQEFVSPELCELLINDPFIPVPWQKSWEEAKENSWLTLNTSGTRGELEEGLQ